MSLYLEENIPTQIASCIHSAPQRTKYALDILPVLSGVPASSSTSIPSILCFKFIVFTEKYLYTSRHELTIHYSYKTVYMYLICILLQITNVLEANWLPGLISMHHIKFYSYAFSVTILLLISFERVFSMYGTYTTSQNDFKAVHLV